MKKNPRNSKSKNRFRCTNASKSLQKPRNGLVEKCGYQYSQFPVPNPISISVVVLFVINPSGLTLSMRSTTTNRQPALHIVYWVRKTNCHESNGCADEVFLNVLIDLRVAVAHTLVPAHTQRNDQHASDDDNHREGTRNTKGIGAAIVCAAGLKLVKFILGAGDQLNELLWDIHYDFILLDYSFVIVLRIWWTKLIDGSIAFEAWWVVVWWCSTTVVVPSACVGAGSDCGYVRSVGSA